MVNPDDSREQQNQRLVKQAQYIERKVETIIDDWREFGNVEAIGDDLNLFIISTHAAIEDATAHIITRYIIDDQFSDVARDYVFANMSQAHREQLLADCEVLSDSTRGDLGRFRSLRNVVAHEPFARLDWSEQNVEDKIRCGVNGLRRLTDAAVDSGWMTEISRRDDNRI